MTARRLSLVSPPQRTENLLREALLERDQAARTVAKLDAAIAEQLRTLAKERGLAFIRIESARRELLA